MEISMADYRQKLVDILCQYCTKDAIVDTNDPKWVMIEENKFTAQRVLARKFGTFRKNETNLYARKMKAKGVKCCSPKNQITFFALECFLTSEELQHAKKYLCAHVLPLITKRSYISPRSFEKSGVDFTECDPKEDQANKINKKKRGRDPDTDGPRSKKPRRANNTNEQDFSRPVPASGLSHPEPRPADVDREPSHSDDEPPNKESAEGVHGNIENTDNQPAHQSSHHEPVREMHESMDELDKQRTWSTTYYAIETPMHSPASACANNWRLPQSKLQFTIDRQNSEHTSYKPMPLQGLFGEQLETLKTY